MLPGRGGGGREGEREQSWPWPKPLTPEGLLFGSQCRGGWIGTDGVMEEEERRRAVAEGQPNPFLLFHLTKTSV